MNDLVPSTGLSFLAGFDDYMEEKEPGYKKRHSDLEDLHSRFGMMIKSEIDEPEMLKAPFRDLTTIKNTIDGKIIIATKAKKA